MRAAHVVGAGLAGLSCALQLLDKGFKIHLYEAAGQAGGRCRSFHDAALDRLIDNGNHLLLSGNISAMRFLDRVGASSELIGPPEARLNFVDLRDGERWTFRPNSGPVPWWIFSSDRRVAGTVARDYFPARALFNTKPADVFTDLISDRGLLYERFWEPLVVGALNISPDRAAANLLKPVLMETFAKGAKACHPLIAKTGLGISFIDPALKVLKACGSAIKFGHLLKALEFSNSRVSGLSFGSGTLQVGNDDVVVLAVPHWIASNLLPGYSGPTMVEPIVNIHFRLEKPVRGMDEDPVLGVIGGMAQWIFVRGDIVSVTVSAAAKQACLASEKISMRVWKDVAKALFLSQGAIPRWRVIKERRATFLQTPDEVRRRPGSRTGQHNLFLAGDWTDTQLPATIEGAIRSGEFAAGCIGPP